MPKEASNIKLDITKCVIIITEFNYFELHLNNKLLRSLSFNEFMKYRKYVSRVIGKEYLL